MVNPSMSLPDFLKHRHAEIQLYVVFMTPTEHAQPTQTEAGAEMLRQHFLYLWRLEEAGKLFACGPLEAGPAGREGMCILAVSSRAEAEAIARAEPFIRAGWRSFRVRGWQLNEGDAVATGRKLTAPA